MVCNVFVVMSIILEVGAEWVELPKLEPWPVEADLERVKQIVRLTSNASLEHLHNDDNSFIKVSFGNVVPEVSSRNNSESGGAPNIAKNTKSEKQSKLKPKSDVNNTSEITNVLGRDSLPEVTDNYYGPQLEPQLLTPEPTAASNLNLTRDETSSPVDSTNQSENYPNRSYTYLDPLVESLLLKVHQTLVSHSAQPVKQKIHYLQSLQNNILNQIWKRSQRLWVVEAPEARGHEVVHFPSMEGALLTISFLTFAVFLIKVVKQFINGMQSNNTMMIEVPMNPTRVRLKRDDVASQAEHVMKIIEEFHLQHAKEH